MKPKLLLMCIMSLALSGCYESQDLLLDRSSARQPLTAGDRLMTGEDGDQRRIQISLRPDGWYDVRLQSASGRWDEHIVLFNDLVPGNPGSLFAFATYDSSEGAYIYGILATDADGSARFKTSDCHRKADTDIALYVGHAQKLVDSCQFSRKADRELLAALRALANNPKHWETIAKS